MNQRLFFFTGKGGVGKTAFSLAYTEYLKKEGKKVYYISFGENSNSTLCSKLKIPYQRFEAKDSIEKYMAKKLNSTTIASWLMKTPFVDSLFNMIPGLGQMILLGHLVDDLLNDPNLYLVVDSPASGHALTMFESTHNFLTIFEKGVLAQDIHKIHDFIQNPDNVLINILAIPTEMALSEATELQSELGKIANLPEPKIIINDIFSKAKALLKTEIESLPTFIKEKCEQEKSLINDFKQNALTIEHFPSIDLQTTIECLMPHMEGIK